jgi:Protein NO VEIN, C-terminal
MASHTAQTVRVFGSSVSHLPVVVEGLLKTGWRIAQAPHEGRLPRNGLHLVLKSKGQDIRVRLFVYKVTGSSRNQPTERRIEITSTYRNGRITRLDDFQDLVLGFDQGNQIFVGVDGRRIEEGGQRGNASSFFDRDGLAWSGRNEILIMQREVRLFPNGVEFHAFFKSECLAEYLLNANAIHDGTYVGSRLRSKRAVASNLLIPRDLAVGNELVLTGAVPAYSRVSPQGRLVKAFETGGAANLPRRKISQERLLEIKRRCEENGRIGEEFVVDFEQKRLKKLGRLDLSERVKWVSPSSACEGYDVLSYEVGGTSRFIEVKSTVANAYVFEMSNNEWQVAKNKGEQYYIYRVTSVRNNPRVKIFPNPSDLEEKGLLTRSPSGWWVRLE